MVFWWAERTGAGVQVVSDAVGGRVGTLVRSFQDDVGACGRLMGWFTPSEVHRCAGPDVLAEALVFTVLVDC